VGSLFWSERSKYNEEPDFILKFLYESHCVVARGLQPHVVYSSVCFKPRNARDTQKLKLTDAFSLSSSLHF
jgi:hypothetical protein